MKIYLITAGSYSDYHIHAVFLTRELAQAYLDLSPSRHVNEFNEIEEWEALDHLPRCAVTFAASGFVCNREFLGARVVPAAGALTHEKHWRYEVSEIDGPLPGRPHVTIQERDWGELPRPVEITVRGADEGEVKQAFQDRVAQARAELAGVAS